jgi:hypothetical protein
MGMGMQRRSSLASRRTCRIIPNTSLGRAREARLRPGALAASSGRGDGVERGVQLEWWALHAGRGVYAMEEGRCLTLALALEGVWVHEQHRTQRRKVTIGAEGADNMSKAWPSLLSRVIRQGMTVPRV